MYSKCKQFPSLAVTSANKIGPIKNSEEAQRSKKKFSVDYVANVELSTSCCCHEVLNKFVVSLQ